MRRLRCRTAVLILTAGALWWVALLPSSADVKRDPFLFGVSADRAAPWAGELIGILWDATSPLAMVGDQAVSVGSELGPWKVVEIHPDGMVLQLGERREFIRIGDRLPSN